MKLTKKEVQDIKDIITELTIVRLYNKGKKIYDCQECMNNKYECKMTPSVNDIVKEIFNVLGRFE